MKLLTFLGAGKYNETVYAWQNAECRAKFAPVASCQFLKPDSLVVFLTEKAQQDVYPDFRAALPPELGVQEVWVPLGANDAELWQVFAQVSGAVNPGEEVAFDITHGLRSSPLISLLVAAFLRAGLRVSIRAALYGAYDIGQQVSPGRTPMFDLSPMLSMLEWAAAADRFNRSGDARDLASLLEDERHALAKAADGDRQLLEQAGGLGNLAGALKSISKSLHLIRPYQAMEQVAGLPNSMARARPALERSAAAQPFGLLLDGVSQAYAPLAQAAPRDPTHAREMLMRQRAMVRWYFERDLWAQAVSLAREWAVSWLMFQLKNTDFTDKTLREQAERMLGEESEAYRTAGQERRAYNSLLLSLAPGLDRMLELWSALAGTRNDTLHAGMRPAPGNPDNLIAQIKKHLETLEALPL